MMCARNRGRRRSTSTELRTMRSAVAEAVLHVVEDAGSPIRIPVGIEAETFVRLLTSCRRSH